MLLKEYFKSKRRVGGLIANAALLSTLTGFNPHLFTIQGFSFNLMTLLLVISVLFFGKDGVNFVKVNRARIK